jgi:hypothetical protein
MIAAENGATTTATTVTAGRKKLEGQAISSPPTSFLSKDKYTSNIHI